MKKLLIYTCCILMASMALSQRRPKYKDELPKILALPSAGTTALLKVYQKEEPENASIDFQLGVAYEKRYRESDILTDYKYKYGNARQSLFYFSKANIRVDEKDVRRNEEHYFNFGEVDDRGRVDVEFDSVSNKIKNSIPELREFIDHAPGIYREFTQSFSHYDEAHKIYTEILGEYQTEKDLYLLFDEELNARLEQVKNEYLEAIKHFKAYQDSISVYPIGYDQDLIIKELSVYKLDGLESQINFLQPEVSVWNYAKWVDDTRQYINENIDNLRADLAKENLRIDQVLESAQPDFIREEFTPLDIDKEILFTLRKYDLNSVIEPIFLYKEAKHDLIYQSLLSQSLDTSSTVDENRKMYLYGQMINKIRDADSILMDVTKRNTADTHEKYNRFLTQYYNGQQGIANFVQVERSTNERDFQSYVSTLREKIFAQYAVDSAITEINYGGASIPYLTSRSAPNEVLTADYVTTHKIINFDSSAFIGGIKLNEQENKTQAFVAGITDDGEVGWYNEYLLQIDSASFDAHTRLAAMTVVPGGVMFILNGLGTETGERVNHLIRLDESGQETLSKRLIFREYPRSMDFNETDNSLLVTLKGEDYLNDIFINNELIIANYNILGDLKWQQRLEYKGDVVAVTNLRVGYMLLGNYNTLKGLDGKILRAGEKNIETRAFVANITGDGVLIKITPVEAPGSYFVNDLFKVSDDCINLLGSNGTYQTNLIVDTEPETFVHFILNSNADVLSNSIDQ